MQQTRICIWPERILKFYVSSESEHQIIDRGHELAIIILSAVPRGYGEDYPL